MYLLDTDVVSALGGRNGTPLFPLGCAIKRPTACTPASSQWAKSGTASPDKRRRQPEFAAQLERWLESVTALFKDRVLIFDDAAARRWGVLHAELGFTSSDLQIAAIAWSRGLTVVTRNVRHFEPTGVSTLNPIE